jgi:hypothetical protein
LASQFFDGTKIALPAVVNHNNRRLHRAEKMISLWWALVAFWVGGFAGVLLVALMLVSRAAFGSGSAAD